MTSMVMPTDGDVDVIAEAAGEEFLRSEPPRGETLGSELHCS